MSRAIVTNRLKLGKVLKAYRAAAGTMLSEIARHLEGEAADVLRNHSHASGRGHIYKGSLFDDLACERFDDLKNNLQGVSCFVRNRSTIYGEVIHNQRDIPAKAPPFHALSEWVAFKLGIDPDDPSHYPIVKKIQSNIAKNGLKSIGRDGLQFFWDPLMNNRELYFKWIGAAVRAAQVK